MTGHHPSDKDQRPLLPKDPVAAMSACEQPQLFIPDRVHQTILTAARQHLAAVRRARRWRQALAAAAAVILVLTGTFWVAGLFQRIHQFASLPRLVVNQAPVPNPGQGKPDDSLTARSSLSFLPEVSLSYETTLTRNVELAWASESVPPQSRYGQVRLAYDAPALPSAPSTERSRIGLQQFQLW